MKQHLLITFSLIAVISGDAYARDALSTVADITQVLNPALAAGTTIYLKDWDGTKQWAYSQGSTFAATEAMKYGLNNVHIGGTRLGERPNGKDYNMPSGHTSSACAGGYFIGKRYGWEYGVAPMGLALATGYSRVRDDQHTWPAVIVGCALGVAANEIFTTEYHKVSVMPYVEGDGAGITATYRW